MGSPEHTDQVVPSYKYQPVDAAKSEIRLLWVPQKANRSSSNSGYALTTSILDGGRDFVALSYCWGGQPLDRPITISGSQMFITESLDNALSSLRSKDDGFYIWADAICINQQDDNEKTWQVQLMRRIYGAATRVVIWLGPSTAASDHAFIGIRELGRLLIEIGLWDAVIQQSNELVSWLSGKRDEQASFRVRRTILNVMAQHLDHARNDRHPFKWLSAELYRRPWFNRVWCIQECTNARTATFRCGQSEADFTMVAAVSFYMRLFGMYLRGLLIGPLKHQAQANALADTLYSPIPTTIMDLRMKCLVSPGHNLRHYLDQINVRNNPQEGVMDATQDIDRVYALLGVASGEAAAEIVPDYSLSCAQAYTVTARALLEHGHDDILSLCRSERRTLGLPSWVPDWAAPMRTPWSLFNRTDWSFSACGCFNGRLTVMDMSSIGRHSPSLALRGVMVDTIGEAGHCFHLNVDEIPDRSFLVTLRPYFCDITAYLSKSKQYTPEQKAHAEWRIPIGDGHSDDLKSEYVRAPADSHMKVGLEHAKTEYGWNNTGTMFEVFTDDTRPYACFIDRFRRMYDSRPFFSRTGYVGLCPKESQPGDVIAILMGVRVPYIIRPSAQRTWTLIGEAYVHSIMDGEFMDTNPTIEDITLV
ncbi:HET-domain-containing protein [Macroventuria anomochaeta]|uniref:HET-domain-containing protein n=1 Tax=Macroventuria anomochaeta TaxID=301207 RepID=A0ACB6RXU1_9PLEO|nr:HET-domain-containing protein [Macroventuria anomochaeta]KAF2626522.1 HET-domain-containing protein [Macroventuria anomochaeta]